MRTHTIISFISFTLALITGCALLRLVVMKRPAKETGTDRADHYLIIIHAGHGGMDGGAVGVNGRLLEKDLNLSVAKKLSAICSAAGVDNILTRTEATATRSSDRLGEKPPQDARPEKPRQHSGGRRCGRGSSRSS